MALLTVPIRLRHAALAFALVLGAGLVVAPSSPAVGTAKADIPAGYDRHECMVTNGHVKCWGANNLGQLGDGTVKTRATAVTVSGISTALSVSVGTFHSCAILTNHTVRCWGDNESGQLGNGTTTNSRTPVTVSGITTATSVSVGGLSSCARLSNGTVKCWGWNILGQLGNGTTADAHRPVLVSGITTATSVVTGDIHACARLISGTVKCWGSNDAGQLGNGSTAAKATKPVTVQGIATATAVSSTADHTCALLASGGVACWGLGSAGQLGDGASQNRNAPVSVTGITTARAVAAGFGHSCALLADGSPVCWGDNFYGQLGTGTNDASPTPIAVAGISTAARIEAHGFFSCAVLASAGVRCWGLGTDGQLGNGLKSASNVPVAVTGVTVDVIPPTVTTPVVRPRTGAKLSGSSEPVAISWTGADTGGAGLARYTLQVTKNAGATWTTLVASTTATSYAWLVPTGGTDAFRVRATDKLNNVSAWGTTRVLAPSLRQQTSSSLTYTGTWRSQASASFSGGSTKYATAPKAAVSITTPAATRSAALVATKGPTRGRAYVYVDGVRVATVDCYAATIAYRAVVWQATWSSPGSHQVKFVVLGTRGRPRVDLDALLVTTEPVATAQVTVMVPVTTDGTAKAVTMPGSFSQLGGGLPDFDASNPVLSRVDATHWTFTFSGRQGTAVDYKYALGDWSAVEKGAACEELANRRVTLAWAPGGPQTVDDTVLNWAGVDACAPPG